MRAACIAVALISTAPAAAQDYDPSMSAHESMSRQQFTTQQTRLGNHMLRQSVRRNGGGPTAAQVRACAGRAKFRAEHGADNPKVRRLYDLCRSVGL